MKIQRRGVSITSGRLALVTIIALCSFSTESYGARLAGYLFDGQAGTASPGTITDVGGDSTVDLTIGSCSTYNADTPFSYAGNTSFDVSCGVNARAENMVTEAFEFENTDAFSVSLWMNTTQGDAFQQIVGQRQNNTGNGWYLGLARGPTSVPVDASAFFFTQGQSSPDGRGANDETANAALNDGQWHHIVGVHDPASDLDGLGDGEIFLYVDGALVASHKKTQTESIDYTSFDPFFNVGTGRDGGGTFSQFGGLVDEVAIFDSALGQSEVDDLFNNSLNAGPGTPGDFNNDNMVDNLDIDLMRDAVINMTSDSQFNVDGLGDPDIPDESDFDHLVVSIIGSGRGDGDLSLNINFDDFVLLCHDPKVNNW